jgi:hypothetical protein
VLENILTNSKLGEIQTRGRTVTEMDNVLFSVDDEHTTIASMKISPRNSVNGW